MINKFKHWWYTYIKNEPQKSPFYYRRCEITRRALKKFDIRPNKTYVMNDNINFSVAIDNICGDAVFMMVSEGNIPVDVVRSYMIDANNFLHIQCDGVGYRQHMWYVSYKYFMEDDEHSAKFDADMLKNIVEHLAETIDEIKEN